MYEAMYGNSNKTEGKRVAILIMDDDDYLWKLLSWLPGTFLYHDNAVRYCHDYQGNSYDVLA